MRISRRASYAVAAIAGAAVATVWGAGSILSASVNRPVGPPPAFLRASTVAFPSESGAVLSAWYGPPEAGASTVVLSHGVYGSKAQLADRARFIREAGYGILLYDAQGHGESIASRVTFGFLEAHDARAAVGFARAQAPGSRVAFVGPSLAGASALLGPEPLPVDALVLEAVYPTLEDAVRNRIAMRLGNALAVFLTHALFFQVEPRLGFDPYALNPIDRIHAVQAPILLLAGSADEHTTLDESRALHRAAPTGAELWVIDGAAHQNFHRYAGDEYERRILSFLRRHLSNGRSTSSPG